MASTDDKFGNLDDTFHTEFNAKYQKKGIRLPFEPRSAKYKCFLVEITPEIARHILQYYNEDNRGLSNTQVNRIFKSIEHDNWLLDGQPITFNIEGNLTEGQHRLSAIAKCKNGRKFLCVIVTGVQLEVFSKAATNKPRRPFDEIKRHNKKAVVSQASVLGDILKRRKGDKLCIQNAIFYYDDWIKDIKIAQLSSGEYEKVFTKFTNQRKTVSAYIALCERFGKSEECATFLELLNEELRDDDEDSVSSTLTLEFVRFWNRQAVDLSNEKRMDLLYAMLCYATDQTILREDGMINFNATPTDLDHDAMRKQGVYRKFLA